MFWRSFVRRLPLFAGVLSNFALTPLCKQKSKNEIYIWGNGVYQARPDALLQFQNFVPKKIENIPKNIVRLSFGQYYEAGIDEDNNLYVWLAQKLDANMEKQSKQDKERTGLQTLSKNITDVKFTAGYIWALSDKGEVIQYPIIKEFDQNKEVKSVKIGTKRTVDPLKGSVQIATGDDHIIALNGKGQVFAMGDDTYGQCGQADQGRTTHPPFTEKRVSYPLKIEYLKNIKKIASGANHCLALDSSGSLYGWGSNSNLQLSHEEQFSQLTNPLICSYIPIRINKNLDNNDILDIAGGEEFSVIISKNRLSDSFEVHTVGCNLKGQLGIGQIRHIRDVTKVQSLSNFILRIKGKEEKVQVNQIECGRNHCIVKLNIGYVMEWGDNQYGQMGNKKRSVVYSPIIVRQFSEKDILGVFASQNSSGVILREKSTDNAEVKTAQQSKK